MAATRISLIALTHVADDLKAQDGLALAIIRALRAHPTLRARSEALLDAPEVLVAALFDSHDGAWGARLVVDGLPLTEHGRQVCAMHGRLDAKKG